MVRVVIFFFGTLDETLDIRNFRVTFRRYGKKSNNNETKKEKGDKQFFRLPIRCL